MSLQYSLIRSQDSTGRDTDTENFLHPLKQKDPRQIKEHLKETKLQNVLVPNGRHKVAEHFLLKYDMSTLKYAITAFDCVCPDKHTCSHSHRPQQKLTADQHLTLITEHNNKHQKHTFITKMHIVVCGHL